MPLPNDYMREAIRLTEQLLVFQQTMGEPNEYLSSHIQMEIYDRLDQIADLIEAHRDDGFPFSIIDPVLFEQLSSWAFFFDGLCDELYYLGKNHEFRIALESIEPILEAMYEQIGEYRPVHDPSQLKILFAA